MTASESRKMLANEVEQFVQFAFSIWLKREGKQDIPVFNYVKNLGRY
jgi:hypothetical protein